MYDLKSARLSIDSMTPFRLGSGNKIRTRLARTMREAYCFHLEDRGPVLRSILLLQTAYRTDSGGIGCQGRDYSKFHVVPTAQDEIMSERSRRRSTLTRSMRGSWKLKYSCRMAWVSVTFLRYISEAADMRERISSSCL